MFSPKNFGLMIFSQALISLFCAQHFCDLEVESNEQGLIDGFCC
jgi:hypothetical protein